MIYETFDGLADVSHDVCIVGAGPVGISLAIELGRIGFKVLLLSPVEKRRMPTSNSFPLQILVSPENFTMT